MVNIGNEILEVSIDPKGAELQQLLNKKDRISYLWKGDPAYWGKFSPVLFPVVGTLKNNSYTYNGKDYTLARHGFARDKIFEVEEHSADRAIFLLKNNAETILVFPFFFEFRLIYQVTGNSLSLTYDVRNPAEKDLLFSVGGHPAFAIPLTAGTSYSDYYLLFEKKENAVRWPISPEGCLQIEPVPLLENTDRLLLTKELFHQDALVIKRLSSGKVSLKCDHHIHGWTFDFGEFPYLGIWASKDADFVCIEPWCGVADSVDHNGLLEQKEGIIRLKPANSFQATWSISCY